MKVYWREITDLELELDFTVVPKDAQTEATFTKAQKEAQAESAWLEEAVLRADESQSDSETPAPATPALKARPMHAHFTFSKVDEVAVVNGYIETQISLICSRCAHGFMFTPKPSFSALFCKDPVMGGVAYLQKQGDPDPDAKGSRTGYAVTKPAGQNKGYARHAHDFSADEESNVSGASSDRDLDITYLSEDYINLADVVTEQLALQIPFQPLCKESCKGMCSNCGADLNVGRCACAKILQNPKKHPFSALKDYKVST